jgi:Tfp pilus assembly protein PilF
MLSRNKLQLVTIVILSIFALLTTAQAEPAFDFGLPLFGYEEVRFEKTKTPDFNLQFLKKYILEHQGYILHQFHGITRWISLIKLSDKPKQKRLIKMSKDWFSTASSKEVSQEERLREIFFNGVLLTLSDSQSNDEDSALEDLLLDSEVLLQSSPDYFICKGLIFHLLRNRPNNYFAPMKPEEDLKKALVMLPKSAHYYFVMGQAFRFLGTNDSTLFLAIASYEKAASLDPRNGKLQNFLLGIYMGLHEGYQLRQKKEPFWLEEAVYKKILTLSPNNPYALNNLGYLYAEYGVNTRIAQDLCQRAVDLNPDNAGFRDSLGWAAFKNRDFVSAEEELKKSIAMRNNVYDANYHMATLYYATGKPNQAEEYYRKALQLKPDAAESLNNLAYLLAEQNKKIEEAMGMAKLATKLEPNNASYLDTLGWLFYRKGDLDSALISLLKAAQLAPDQGEILMHIGVVYLDKGNFSVALDYLKQAWKADKNLAETQNAIYIALRLKAYYQTLAEYHGMLGKNADKNRICNILMGISRIYQEEHQYDKAIEFTRLCSEVRSNEISLAEPLFPFYSFTEKTISEDEEIMEPPKVSLEDDSPGSEINVASEETLEKLPSGAGYPLVISLGPDFFKLASALVPNLEQFSTTSVSFFIQRVFRPGKNLVIRIESEDIAGSAMLSLVADYFAQINAEISETKQTDSLHISLGNKELFAVADRNFLYLFPKTLPDAEKLEKMNQICPHTFNSVISFFYDWKELQKRIPRLLRPFVSNPMGDFCTAFVRYFYQGGVLNEFSILSTGKVENSAFMRKLARKLFAFKMQSKAIGLESTIKLRNEQEHIYLSIDLEEFDQYISGRFSPFAMNMLKRFFLSKTAKIRCFLQRMFYTNGCEANCIENGKMQTEAETGLINCSVHQNLPAIPAFINEAEACHFYRQRLEAIIAKQRDKLNFSNESLLIELIKEYNTGECPTEGKWELNKEGKINCSDHEN